MEKESNLEKLDLRINFFSSEMTARIFKVLTETSIVDTIKLFSLVNVD